jgi:hypothetical protein
MISDQYRCVFIHQRKAAGTSIIRSFGIAPADPAWHRFNDGVLAPEWPPPTGHVVFTAVRNPFDRVVSAWQYLPATRHRPLQAVLEDPPRGGHDYRHFTRQQWATLAGARLDGLLRYETLQRDYDRLSDLVGKPRSLLPTYNATARRRDYRPYFNDRSRQLAADLFKDDLRVFGYDF